MLEVSQQESFWAFIPDIRYSKPIFLLFWIFFWYTNFQFFSENKFTPKKITVFKKNVCHSESLWKKLFVTLSHCVSEKKWPKTVKNCQKRSVLTVFDSFWTFLTVFIIKHSELVWQTFSFLNTVTQCDQHFSKHSDLFF